MEILFWLSVGIVCYTYLGYGMLLYLLLRLKKKGDEPQALPSESLPDLTVLVAAYNEEDCIETKIHNCLALDYPADRLHFLFVTDGSDDATPQIVARYPAIRLLHQAQRAGKVAALNRAMPEVSTSLTVFTDANTLLSPNSLQALVEPFRAPIVGAVSGEKRVRMEAEEDASGAGEGLYWRYESTLKRWDANLYSLVGAAGELFAIRTDCYEALPPDTVIEDFVLTLGIARKGYRVAYRADAIAEEAPSASIADEFTRKLRIAAGAFQAMWRLRDLLNPFRYGVLSWQYFSHRVMRWTLAPLALLLALLSNLSLAFTEHSVYLILLIMQLGFYTLAGIGWALAERKIKSKVFFVPFYFSMMNVAVGVGWLRYLQGQQSVLWKKAQRRG